MLHICSSRLCMSMDVHVQGVRMIKINREACAAP